MPSQPTSLLRCDATNADQKTSPNHSNYLHAVKEGDEAKTLIVAISGCSSSGKTLLSRLLQAVFSDLRLSGSNDTDFPQASCCVIIHEDNHFLPKNLCPSVSYATSHNDKHFVARSLPHDKTNLYSFNPHQQVRPTDNPHNVELVSDGVGSISGPDTDCWEAVNLNSLLTVCI